MDGRIMWHARKKIEMNTGFGFENKKERDYLEDLSIIWKGNMKCVINK